MKCCFRTITFHDTTLLPFSLKKGNMVDLFHLGSIIPDSVQTGNGCLNRRMWDRETMTEGCFAWEVADWGKAAL